MKSTSNGLIDGHEYTQVEFKLLQLTKRTFKEIVFTKCTFHLCNFTESTFTKCIFDECQFIGCTLSMAHFPDSRLTDCRFVNCQLKAIDWSDFKSKLGFKLHCVECDLSYSVFSSIIICESVFKKCTMLEAEFSEATAQKCDFRHSDLERVRFHRTDLSECDFRGAVNYLFNPAENKCKKARFNYPEVLALVKVFGAKIEDPLIDDE